MTHIILAAIVLPELPEAADGTTPDDTDLIDALQARLEEFYPGPGLLPAFPSKVTATVTSLAACRVLADAVDVGLSEPPDLEMTGHTTVAVMDAGTAIDALSLRTLDQRAE